MLIVKIYGLIHQRKGTKKDGTEFEVRYQEGEILSTGRRPRVIEISVPRNGRYEEGLYTLSSRSFRPNDYERIELTPFTQFIPLDEAIGIAEQLLTGDSPQPALKQKRS